jgi:hypothetical protein
MKTKVYAPHEQVIHPKDLEVEVNKFNLWFGSHLAIVFGSIWVVWSFMIIPLVILLFPSGVKNVVFYLSSGWIQLFALPLFVWVGNRLQKASDAQAESMYRALTYIAHLQDEQLIILKKLEKLK